MSQTALVVIGLALVVIVAVLLSGGRRFSAADLVPLSDDARNRYMMEWDRIEKRFVDAPQDAVREADSVVVSVMRERRHPLEERRLPKEVRKARRDATMGRGDRTEGMRRAMLQYRAVMEKMAGARSHDSGGRREMA